jgi:hypothetical protein
MSVCNESAAELSVFFTVAPSKSCMGGRAYPVKSCNACIRSSIFSVALVEPRWATTEPVSRLSE